MLQEPSTGRSQQIPFLFSVYFCWLCTAQCAVMSSKLYLLLPGHGGKEMKYWRVQIRVVISKGTRVNLWSIMRLQNCTGKTNKFYLQYRSLLMRYLQLHKYILLDFLLSSINLLLTGPSWGIYWLEVVAVQAERSEIPTKTTEGQYFPVRLELAWLVGPRLHGSGQKLARFHLAFTWDRWIFERLCVQVWDLLFSVSKLDTLAVQIFVQFRRSHVNGRWNRASFFRAKMYVRTRVNVA